jgi:DNA repair exonuclease SbcCD ATPase subunit
VELSNGETELKKLRSGLVTASQVREPKADSKAALLQQQIEALKEQAKAKKAEADGDSPFVEILVNDRKELEKHVRTCANKEAEVKEAEKKKPYYEYWVKAYGDKGIRKWVVDGIIPPSTGRLRTGSSSLSTTKLPLNSITNSTNSSSGTRPTATRIFITQCRPDNGDDSTSPYHRLSHTL